MGDARLAFYEAKYTSDEERLQPFKVKMLERASHGPQGRMLDLGCATGIISRNLRDAGWHVTGLDISKNAVANYRRHGFAAEVADLEVGIPMPDEAFDGVWMSEIIEHITNWQNLLAEVARVLRPGGRLFLTTPNTAFYGYRMLHLLGRCPTELQHPFHVRFFSVPFLCRTIETHGFAVTWTLGQNIFALLPGRALRAMRGLPLGLGGRAESVLKLVGFSAVPGLIHGEKLMLYAFGRLGATWLSNVIMIEATRLRS